MLGIKLKISIFSFFQFQILFLKISDFGEKN